jgi:formamidopyrimidine-DNA glycosylase
MPELPEVETTKRGIEPHLLNRTIKSVTVRHRGLRWPIPKNLEKELSGQRVTSITRRGKYILINVKTGTLIIHLGMSGSLRQVKCSEAPEKHDHVDIVLGKNCIRYRDPRRFGAVLFTKDEPFEHKLLKDLGPEPLAKSFNAQYLYDKSRNRKISIKQFIMDSKVVVGVGNIYASESLFYAGINPDRQAGKISLQRYKLLVNAIKNVLRAAIKQGGTTLSDFTRADGQPGYFKQKLAVYGRAAEPCIQCGKPIKHLVQGQRASYYCSHCQR